MDISGVRRIRSRHLQADIQDHADILDLCTCKILENRDQIEQLVIVSVREPATDGNRVLRVEDIRSGGVVDDNRFFQISTDL
jgi:hypothetical protein